MCNDTVGWVRAPCWISQKLTTNEKLFQESFTHKFLFPPRNLLIIYDNQRCCEFCSAVLNHNSCLKSCLYHNSDIPWVLFSSPFNTICLKSCLYHNSITSPISQFYYSKMSKAIYRDGGKTYSTLCHLLAEVNSHQSPLQKK